MAKENGKEEDVISLEREYVIPVVKHKLISKLTSVLDPFERAEFLKLCRRVEYTIRAYYLLHFEDLMQLYSLFDPIHGNKILEQLKLNVNIEVLEENFLKCFSQQIMEKSNFKLATNEEIKLALSAQYLLNLKIEADESKLDKNLLSIYFEEPPHAKVPGFSNMLIFHRGRGIDHTKDYFYMEKLNLIIAHAWTQFLRVSGLQGFLSTRQNMISNKDTEKTNDISNDPEKEGLVFKRVRIEKMKLSIRELINKTEIQEPTFDRMIVVYRLASTNEKIDRGIYIKHYKSIPMADMELVLPEKKPSLTPVDWVNFLYGVIIGLVTYVSSFQMPKADIRVLIVLFGLIAYCVKIYSMFQQNLATYNNVLIKLMHEKQLDSGKGTLLHLCDDVIQQEVKEVIIPYFILMTKGKSATTMEELEHQCEELIRKEFNEECNFEVKDAVHKLVKLGLATIDPSDYKIHHVSLKKANEIIGKTTEELVVEKKLQLLG
ncbi:hypothetical protein Cni_G06185 [Canna indica]|uniref:Aminopeptidase n=1 Tax=Canna indica TaxID=4628 RepID=A0AAQ3Q631_9LILI|nr:hypothetical protein Cni_G06185 [Canna indica]